MKCSTYWIAYNSLMQCFVFSHLTTRQDKKHCCGSAYIQTDLLNPSSATLVNFWMVVECPLFLFSCKGRTRVIFF